ncbi:nuclear anchorage protein 1-like [Candoia aspera]|uniref:nuclear anchorage protein 1-like n=1 Tax=Candoia aspera TaxID=51853 RepID=UPI002FD7F16F
MRRSEEIKLHKLFAWKKLLLEHLESNLKLHEEVQTMQPDNTTEKKIQETNEQRKLLTENLEAVVEDVEEMKDYISETGGIIKYLEKDVSTLYQTKQLFLEHLETNLKNLQEAQTVATTHPSSINEQKVSDLTNERRLLIAGLEALIQDLQDMLGITKEKVKSKKQVLEELCEQKGFLLENLASNLKYLKQTQSLAAAQPDSTNEQNVQELIEERKLLSLALEGIVQNIQNIQKLESSKAEILTPSEIEELSEKRRLYLDNMELNMKDLKDLQTTAFIQPDNEQIVQQLAEKKRALVDSLHGIIQDMEQAQNFDLENGLMKISDERKIHELLVLSTLESNLYELEEIGALSDNQLDVMKRRMHNINERSKSSVQRHNIIYSREHLKDNILDRQKDAIQEFLERKKHLFSYLQASIKNLQQKGIIRKDVSEKDIQDRAEKEMDLNDYLMVFPIDILQSEVAAFSAKFKPDDEKTAKRRALTAKLEANVRDLQVAFEKEKIEKSREESRDHLQPIIRWKTSITQPSDHQLFKASLSALQITRPPMIRNLRYEETTLDSTKSDGRPTSSIIQQHSEILRREVDLPSKCKLATQSLHRPPGLLPSELSKQPAVIAFQEILEYNRTLLPGHKTNLRQAFQFAQQRLLQQQTNLLAERLKGMSLFLPQPAGTSRFQVFSLQPSKPVWEANQLTQKCYSQKLNLLKRRLLGPEIKSNIKGGTCSSPFQGLTPLANQVQHLDSIAISGKGYHPQRKLGTSPGIWQNLRNN